MELTVDHSKGVNGFDVLREIFEKARIDEIEKISETAFALALIDIADMRSRELAEQAEIAARYHPKTIPGVHPFDVLAQQAVKAATLQDNREGIFFWIHDEILKKHRKGEEPILLYQNLLQIGLNKNQIGILEGHDLNLGNATEADALIPHIPYIIVGNGVFGTKSDLVKGMLFAAQFVASMDPSTYPLQAGKMIAKAAIHHPHRKGIYREIRQYLHDLQDADLRKSLKEALIQFRVPKVPDQELEYTCTDRAYAHDREENRARYPHTLSPREALHLRKITASESAAMQRSMPSPLLLDKTPSTIPHSADILNGG